MSSNRWKKFIDGNLAGVEYSYEHFAERLSSRYGLTITMDEYIELFPAAATKDNTMYRVTVAKRAGTVQFKGRELLIIRCTNTKLINTCLLVEEGLPVPSWYRRRGITKERFNYDIRVAINICEFLADYLDGIGMDKRRFFAEDIFPFPKWMLSAAYQRRNPRHPFMHKLVERMYSLHPGYVIERIKNIDNEEEYQRLFAPVPDGEHSHM